MIKVMKECHDELEVKDMTEQVPQPHHGPGMARRMRRMGGGGDEKDEEAFVDHEAVKTKHFTEYAGASVAGTVKRQMNMKKAKKM